MVYSVTKYGAVGDGATNDAAAIQSAIDACNAAGGGRVVLEGGHTYYSSSIELKSNVELHLEQGALLKAHSDISTYSTPTAMMLPWQQFPAQRPWIVRWQNRLTPLFTPRMQTTSPSRVRAQWTAMFMPL